MSVGVALDKAPIFGQTIIGVPRTDNRPTRKATITVRAATVTLDPPVSRKKELVPKTPPDLKTAIFWIAKRGGFIGRMIAPGPSLPRGRLSRLFLPLGGRSLYCPGRGNKMNLGQPDKGG